MTIITRITRKGKDENQFGATHRRFAYDTCGMINSMCVIKILNIFERGITTMKMIYTGERVIPEIMNSRNGLLMEHIARYEYAAESVRGRVLDLGCGVGYGAEIILDLTEPNYVSEVVGVDIDENSIQYAKEMYGYLKARFHVADIRSDDLPEQLGLFDSIICFEVIEHLKEDLAVIENIFRMLQPEGELIISTPFGQGKGKPCACAYHVHQYKEEEFRALLDPFFHVEMYGQRDTVIERKQEGMKYYLMIACCKRKKNAPATAKGE